MLQEGGKEMSPEEVSRMVSLYGNEVYRFARKLFAGASEADDLYQQTFLNLLEHSYVLDAKKNPRAFLFSIAYHLYKSQVRRQARRFSIAPQVSYEAAEAVLEDPGESLEEQAIKGEEADQIRQAVKGLPDKYRIPVLLFYAFDLSVEEISRIEKIPKGTVKSRLYKARELLRKELERYG